MLTIRKIERLFLIFFWENIKNLSIIPYIGTGVFGWIGINIFLHINVNL